MGINSAIILRQNALHHPQRTAIRYQGESLSFAELDLWARKFAALLHKLKLPGRQHVALILPDTPIFTKCYFGALYAGWTVVPLHPQLTGEEISWHLQDSDSVVIIAWKTLQATVESAFQDVATCQHIFLTDRTGELYEYGADRASDESETEPLLAHIEPINQMTPTGSDDLAVLLYTSGTTGRAKACALSHQNIFFSAEASRHNVLPINDETVAMACLPLHHAFGQLIQNSILAASGCLVLGEGFDPFNMLKLVQEERVNLMAAVPTMWLSLLAFDVIEKFDLSSLQYCITGGAAIPIDKMLQLEARLNMVLLEGYGTSELCATGAFNLLHRDRMPGSVGEPTWGLEFRLIGDDGEIISGPNSPGSLHISGPSLMVGYYKRASLNAMVIKDGWFDTGDIAEFDDLGRWYIVGRKKKMINKGGLPVFPLEIERVLSSHPEVSNARVYGVTDPLLGEEIEAEVMLSPDSSLQMPQLQSYLAQKLAPYKRPRKISVISSFDITSSGKIKNKLPT